MMDKKDRKITKHFLERYKIMFWLLIWFAISAAVGNEDVCYRDKCQRPTVVTGTPMGRLGNHIWTYMIKVTLRLKYNIDYAITKETKEYLTKYFEGLDDLPTLEEDYCFYNDFYDQYRSALDTKIKEHYERLSGVEVTLTREGARSNIHPPEVVARYGILPHVSITRSPEFQRQFEVDYSRIPGNCSHRWEPFYGLYSDLESHRENKAFLMLGPSVDGPLFNSVLAELEEVFFNELKLQSKYLNQAQATLSRIKATHLKRFKTKKEIVFVGVHSRRTDHIFFEHRRGYKPLKPVYFIEAMHLFREKFKKKSPVFVFVSDDMEWGKSKFQHRVKDLYFDAGGDPENQDMIGLDFALLANCNHTIESHGSFSYFAGAFAGGLVVTPEHFPEFRSDDKKHLKILQENPLEKPLPRLPFF